MSSKGKERTTRNSSQTRGGGKGPQTTDPHAAEMEVAHELLSPHDGNVLPGGNKNKGPTDANNAQVSLPKGQNRGRTPTNKGKPEHACVSNSSNSSNDQSISTAPTPTPPHSEGDNRDNPENRDKTEDPSQENHLPLPHEVDSRELPDFPSKEKQEGKTHESKTGEPWHTAFLELKATSEELRAIRARMEKLDSIEAATSKLTTQLTAVVEKTSELETKVGNHDTQVTELENKARVHDTQVQEMKEELSSLRNRMEQQDKKIEEILQLKADYKKVTRKTIGEMNDLIQVQKDQVDSFHETTRHVKEDILIEVDDRIEELSEDVNYTKLKNQAYRNRQNLVITGLKEEESTGPKKAASDFIKETLNIKDVEIEEAYRIGTPPTEGSSYCRPIVVRFAKLTHRKKVWKNKINITAEDGNHQIRIQADLPKKLREEVKVLYRVAKAAASSQKYKSVVVRDYAICWEDREYRPSQLESLPRPLRPSTLAVRKSDQALVFFSRHSKLSNDHPSIFKYQDHTYQNMEQFLAHKRAKLSTQKHLIHRALKAKNPADAKAILNSLKDDHVEEWEENVEKWATEGIRAKFNQNENLANYLCNTGNLQLGEASRNEKWGVGMDLDHKEVLNFQAWPNSSNLLGKTLMKIRQELQESRANKEETTTNEKRA